MWSASRDCGHQPARDGALNMTLPAVALLLGCTSVPLPAPTQAHPVAMCAISCTQGFLFRPQHICRGGSRLFADFLARGEKTTRSIDGTVVTDVWISESGDYAKADVERGLCSQVIAAIIRNRDPEMRGMHPGEDEQGRPINPR